MENTLAYSFTLFGDFTEIAKNIINIAKEFPGYEKNVQNRISGSINGMPIQTYIFTKRPERIVLTNNRIDYTYNIDLQETLNKNKVDLLTSSNDCLSKVFKSYDNIINRIAINSDYFFENVALNTLQDLLSTSVAHFINENTNEFNLRFNSPIKVLEKQFNNIITISRGEIQNKHDFTTRQGVLVHFDFNSVVHELDGGISFAVACELFAKMLDVIKNNEQKIKEMLVYEEA